ncbi:Olfactory receptor 3A2 [Camelus dromedarius]|uniref:Olfactory receptor 3A2 n=1 Tax=Camelus dromedarius TaxID=9838 RepID=A0A5N4D5F6_CAMDR|nr:Olfactory receptor 3A2 [Camelus dromedarius]
MEPEPGANGTAVTEFVLLGLVETPELRPAVFVLFLLAYLVTVGGNLSILAAILVEPKLHKPMYFFLGNLSVLDIGCITVTVPSMLVRLLSHKHTVPYAACLTQLFFFHQLAGVDCYLLTAMAYDRFLAICRPLTYSTHMSQTVQRTLVAVSWACAFSNALTHTVAISTLNFCGATCDSHFTSYIHLALQSCDPLCRGQEKAFSTCGSHLTMVGIFYGTGVFSYMRLGSVEASDKDKGIGILNTSSRPMLNHSLQPPEP